MVTQRFYGGYDGKTVLVVIPTEERHKEKLERAGKGCRFVYASPQTASEEMIEAADAIIGNVKPDRLHAPERLQWLQLNSAGADAYVKPGILTKVRKNSLSSTGGR